MIVDKITMYIIWEVIMEVAKKKIKVGVIAILIVVIGLSFFKDNKMSFTKANASINEFGILFVFDNADKIEVIVDGEVVHRDFSTSDGLFWLHYGSFLEVNKLSNVVFRFKGNNFEKDFVANNFLISSNPNNEEIGNAEYLIYNGHNYSDKNLLEVVNKDNIKMLMLSKVKSDFDFSDLEKLKSLKQLSIKLEAKNKTLDSIGELKNLTSLMLVAREMDDFSFVKDLKNLKSLSVSSKSFDLSNLSGLNSLVDLAISSKSVNGNLSNASMKAVYMNIDEPYQLSDLKKNNLRNVKWLRLYGSFLGGYDDLPKIRNLVCLYLDVDGISEEDIMYKDFPKLVDVLVK